MGLPPQPDASTPDHSKIPRPAAVRHEHRFQEIDLLRFLAAMSVVLFHYTFRGNAADGLCSISWPALSSWSKYGFLGVDMFFMISGFVILKSCQHGELLRFLSSRAARLYPTFWLCATATFVCTLVGGGDVFTATFRQYLWNLTMLSGFMGKPALDGSYWSLFVELQFYAGVAVLLVAGVSHRAQTVLWLWLCATLLGHMGLDSSASRWRIAEYAPLFIGGAACFLVRRDGLSTTRASLLATSCLGSVVGAIDRIVDFEARYDTRLDPWVVGTIIVLMFVAMSAIGVSRKGIVSWSGSIVLGGLTYPLYLLHQNIGYMVFNSAGDSVDHTTLLISTILGLSLLSHFIRVEFESRMIPRFNASVRKGIELLWSGSRRLDR